LVAPRGFFQLYSRAIGARTGFLDRLPHCRDRFLSPACLAMLHHGATTHKWWGGGDLNPG